MELSFTNKIISIIGIILIISGIIIYFTVNNHIIKILERQMYYQIPAIFSVSNSTFLLQEDFSSVSENLKKMFDSLKFELGLAYVSVMTTDKKPVDIFISNNITGEAHNYITKRLEHLGKITPLERNFKIVLKGRSTLIKEVIFPITVRKVIGILRIGYFWKDIHNKQRLLQLLLIVILVITLVVTGISIIFINNMINKMVNNAFLAAQQEIIERTRKKVTDKLTAEQQEKERRQAETDISQKEIFSILDLNNNLNSTQVLEEIITNSVYGLQKLFNARTVMLYFISDTNENYFIGVGGIESAEYIPAEKSAEYHVIKGEDAAGLAVQHNAVIIGDIPRVGYSMSVPLSRDNTSFGVVTIASKSDNSPFSNHDKLVGRILTPILTNAIYNAKA